MKINKILSVLLTFLIACALFAPHTSANGPVEPILADSVILTECDTGAVLYENNADEPRSPDSMVKIMTLLIAAEAIENGFAARNEPATASQSAFSDITSDDASQALTPGEAMPLIDLMYCAYIGSRDEACNIIAEHLAGSVAEFVELMNTRAAELGCTGTFFTNTHGQTDARQISTARDISRIAAAASKCYIFVELASAVTCTVPATNLYSARTFTNLNHMQNEANARYFYKYTVFGKVSVTYEIGYCSVEFAERGEMSLVAVLLGSQAIVTDDGTFMQNLTEAVRLLDWGFSSFAWKTAFSVAQPVAKAAVEHGDGAEFVNLRPQSELCALIRIGDEDDDLTWEITVFSERDGETLTAPIEEGTVLGELVLFQNGKEIGRVPLVADASMSLRRMSLLRQVFVSALQSLWFRVIAGAAAVLFLAYIIIVIRYNIIRARRVKQVNARREELARERHEREFDENEWR